VPDNGFVTTTTAQPPESAKNKRGRETTGDMVRSLGLVLLVVVMVWFFGQAPDSDEKRGVRVIDPAPRAELWTSAVPGAPVPAGLPQGWRPTAAYFDRDPERLRIAHVTPDGAYAEFAASTGPAAEFVPQVAGTDAATDEVEVDGEPWALHVQEDGSRSLVRAFGGVTVVVGTLRATASLEELTTLAASVTASS
jgi:hypothetical protein